MRPRLLILTAVLAFTFVRARAAGAASAFDADGDGYDDATEMTHGYSPYGPGTLEENDADADRLSDGDELTFGADPLRADTDGDGYGDGFEVEHGYDPTDPRARKLRKRVVVTLAGQSLSYYLGPKLIATHPVSTGRVGAPTPTGTFAIQDKIPRAWSARAKLWMPWWMPFIGTKYGLHELPEWPGGKKEGESHLGTPVSGGCVRLGIGPAKELYEWVEVGTEVDIQKS